jgi:zinc transport system substrate-binding protein
MILIMSLIFGGLSGACSNKSHDSKSLSVVANFFPVAEAVREVGGALVDVTNLTPAGVEPHDLELTSRDIDRIAGAALVFYVGSGFQPAVADAAKQRHLPTIDVAAGLLDGADAHFWLDPTRMAKAVDRVRAALARTDPAHRADFVRRASAYEAKLAALDAEYSATLSHCARHEIVTAHAAFSYLALRYGLAQHAITGVSPDAEPDPQRLAELSQLVTRDGVTTVFYEELVPRAFADTLAKDAHVKTAVLNPIEGLTKKQTQAGGTYLSVMRDNLAALAAALDCQVAP